MVINFLSFHLLLLKYLTPPPPTLPPAQVPAPLTPPPSPLPRPTPQQLHKNYQLLSHNLLCFCHHLLLYHLNTFFINPSSQSVADRSGRWRPIAEGCSPSWRWWRRVGVERRGWARRTSFGCRIATSRPTTTTRSSRPKTAGSDSCGCSVPPTATFTRFFLRPILEFLVACYATL